MSNVISLKRDPPLPDDLQSIIDAYTRGKISLHVITIDQDQRINQYSFGSLIPDKVSAASRNRA